MWVPCWRRVNSYLKVSWIDRFLGEPGDAVHAVGQKNTVPVDGRRGRKLVGDVNADAITLDGFNCGAVHLAVEAPAIGREAGREFVVWDFLGDKVVHFDAVHDFPRQCASIGRNDRRVVFSWISGRQVLRRRISFGFTWSVSAGCLVRSGALHLRTEFLQDGSAAGDSGRAGNELAACKFGFVFHRWLTFVFMFLVLFVAPLPLPI